MSMVISFAKDRFLTQDVVQQSDSEEKRIKCVKLKCFYILNTFLEWLTYHGPLWVHLIRFARLAPLPPVLGETFAGSFEQLLVAQ